MRSWAATPSAETDHLAFCQGEATGRPQPIRPRAQGPSTQPREVGLPALRGRRYQAGGGERLWGPGRWLWPSGCQREPGSRPQPGCPLEGGPQGPEGFLPEVPLSPGARGLATS